MDTTKPNLIERRKAWNKTAPSEYALPTEIWREVVARRQRYWELWSRLTGCQAKPEWIACPPSQADLESRLADPSAFSLQPSAFDINDLITLNLDIVQFAQDVIRNCDLPAPDCQTAGRPQDSASRQAGNPELLRAFWHALAGTSGSPGISVLDPTVGSGAFLFAALNILKPLTKPASSGWKRS